MTTKRKFNYTEPTITAQAVDDSGQALWLAFSQDGEGNCVLKKVSAFDPSQVYYSIDIAVTEITKIFISGTNLYLVYDDVTLMGASYSLTNPLTTSTDFSVISGINESPVDLVVDGSDLFYLIPGNTTGENAKLVYLSTAGVFQETIDLIKTGDVVINAISLTIDETSGDLYIITNTSPSELVRVYQITGGSYEWDVTLLSP